MPPATRDYGFARDCAVCGARIPGAPVYEVLVSSGPKLSDVEEFPQCYFCSIQNQARAEELVLWRIASGAYKVQRIIDETADIDYGETNKLLDRVGIKATVAATIGKVVAGKGTK